MFLLPLSLRKKLNSICTEIVLRTETFIHNHVLYVLLISKTYIELIQIPLNGSPETYAEKAIFPICACLCLKNNKVSVCALTKRGLYVFYEKLEEYDLIEMKVEDGSIKSLFGEVIILTSNNFYKLEDLKLTKLRISPYFTKVISFDLIKNQNEEVCVVYKTNSGLSIYSTSGREILRKFSIQRKTFINGNNLFVEEKSNLILFRITNEGLEQKKRFHLNLEGIESVWYSSNGLKIAGYNGDNYYFYHKDVVYSINSLVMSVSEYKNTLFCSSSELIYFVPQDKDAGLKLSGTEYVALKNILENKFSPFVTRTFDYDESNYSRLLENKIDEINWRRPLVKTIYKDKIIHLPEVNESINGIFLSLLVSQAAQIQIKKLICNGLKFIKNTGQGRDYLKMLEVFTKFNHKIYKVFTTLKIDFNRLWTNFTSILDPNEINENLLLKCLKIDFHDVDLNWKGSQKAFYEVIKGINSYKKRLDESFNISDGRLNADNNIKDRILPTDHTSQDVIDYFYEMFLLNRDFIKIFHLSLQTGNNPPADFLEILKEDQTTLEDFPYEKSKIISFIENFLRNEEDYEWFVRFLQGEYSFISYSMKYSKFILRESLSNSSLTHKGLDYFYKGNDPRGVSRLLYKLLKDGKRPEQKYFECVGDYVFVCDHKFIGREYLSQMFFKRKLF